MRVRVGRVGSVGKIAVPGKKRQHVEIGLRVEISRPQRIRHRAIQPDIQRQIIQGSGTAAQRLRGGSNSRLHLVIHVGILLHKENFIRVVAGLPVTLKIGTQRKSGGNFSHLRQRQRQLRPEVLVQSDIIPGAVGRDRKRIINHSRKIRSRARAACDAT